MPRGYSILRIGSLKLFRNDGPKGTGRPTLQLTVEGYAWRAPKLRYGWEPFFVGHFGHEKTVWSYRKSQ